MEKPKIFVKVIRRFWYAQHVGLIFFLNSPEAAKVATLVKFFINEKTHQDVEIQFFSTRFNTYVYRRVSFRAVDIIISKEEEIFSPKTLMMETTISFFVLMLGCLEAEQKTVLTSLRRNCQKLLCTETRIVQPPNQVHRSSMWHMKDNRQGYLFCKRVFIDLGSC